MYTVKFLDGSERQFEKLSNADLRGADFSCANLRGADLSSANLRYADLRGVDLSSANLEDADLRYADLRYADLARADLRYADLARADLRGVDLSSANLEGADLRCVDLTRADLPTGFKIARLDFGGWPVTVTPKATTIGCQTHFNEHWLSASSDWIDSMDCRANSWWSEHSEAVLALIRWAMK